MKTEYENLCSLCNLRMIYCRFGSSRRSSSGCCLLSLLLTLGPWLAVASMWIFTEWVTPAFESNIVPLLGIIFLPLTTFAYVLVWDPIEGGVSGLGLLAIIVALVFDLATSAGTNRQHVPASE